MHFPRLFLLLASALALSSCNPFRQDPAVDVSAELAGAVQVSGSASMTPGSPSGDTTVVLGLANATLGGLRPWQLHRGQCGADHGMAGSSGAYPVAEVGRDGQATASATLPLVTPTEGSYFVMVRASAANDAVTVACGNLAPPTL